MAGQVQGGLLGRWFEELCRIKHTQLKEVATPNQTRLIHSSLPSHGGVYAFWWTGNIKLLKSRDCNRDLSLVGPGGGQIILKIDDDWLGIPAKLPIPLYVGKTASGFKKRVGQHLKLGNEGRILKHAGGAKKRKPPTTSCQLRAGIEHLFPKQKDPRTLLLDNVGLSYVILDGDNHAANRFYLEDMAIGLMRPVLNIDVEK